MLQKHFKVTHVGVMGGGSREGQEDRGLGAIAEYMATSFTNVLLFLLIEMQISGPCILQSSGLY